MKAICLLGLATFVLGLNGIGRADDTSTSSNEAALDQYHGYVGYHGFDQGFQRNVYRHYIYNNPSVVVPGGAFSNDRKASTTTAAKTGKSTTAPSH